MDLQVYGALKPYVDTALANMPTYVEEAKEIQKSIRQDTIDAMSYKDVAKEQAGFAAKEAAAAQTAANSVSSSVAQIEQNKADIANKLDKPEADGATGQILQLDDNGKPIWASNSGGAEFSDITKTASRVEVTDDTTILDYYVDVTSEDETQAEIIADFVSQKMQFGNRIVNSMVTTIISTSMKYPNLPTGITITAREGYLLRVYNGGSSKCTWSTTYTLTETIASAIVIVKREDEAEMTLAETYLYTVDTYDISYVDGSTKTVALPSTAIPKEVITETSNLVNKSLSRTDNRVLRFLVSADAHQDNNNELITKGTAELGQAQGEILKLMGVDFVANLGDLAWGSEDNTVAEVTEQIKTYHKLKGDSVKGENLLYLEGNHDDANYSLEKYPDTPKLTASAINALLYSKNKGVTLDPEHPVDGYCYKDFEHLKVRVICLNTEQGNGDGGVVEGYQLKWFAETALDMSGKTDWQVLTLAHHPLDYGIASLFKDCMNILDAFINGDNFSYTTTDGTAIAINYSNKNCEYIGHFHGHAHAFSVVPMQKYDNGYVDIGAYEICVPNACYLRNNQYFGSTSERIARYSTETTYSKEDKDGKRTSFNLVTICLDKKLIYADNYGAGVDRVISYGEPLATYSITRNLTNCSSSSTAETATQYNAHTETLTAESGYTMSGAEVAVTMNGEDITSMYSNGVLSIPSVTGDIVITVTAVEQAEASYTNQLPISTDTDGNVYNDIGFKENMYLSSGVPTVREDIVTTGFIPIPDVASADYGQVVLYFANCGLDNTKDTKFAFYAEDKSYIAESYGTHIVTADTTDGSDRLGVFDSDNNLVSLDLSEICCYYYKSDNHDTPKYIRFCGKGINSNTIITVNEVIE